MDAKQIGEHIRQHRKKKKLNQTQLGAEIGVDKVTIANYESGKIKVIPFEKRAKMSSVLNIPVSELLYYNEKMACISTNEAVDELRENRLIKAVNAELEEWLLSGDVDYLHKAMAVIRSKIEEDGVEDLVRIKVAPGNGVRVAKAVWNKENGKVYCDCCKESTLRYYNFCPICGCYLLRDEN